MRGDIGKIALLVICLSGCANGPKVTFQAHLVDGQNIDKIDAQKQADAKCKDLGYRFAENGQVSGMQALSPDGHGGMKAMIVGPVSATYTCAN
jgi:hypothetical protein